MLSRKVSQSFNQSTYAQAVATLATKLRARFESGELRGWIEKVDGEPACLGKVVPPLFNLERACGRTIASMQQAAFIIEQASPRARHEAGWSWKDQGGGPSMLQAAGMLMARDVLQYARARGWSVPQAGELPRPRKAA